MWLLGAGASASAGLPTAADMIWQFKQELFVSQRKVSRQSVADLSNPAIQAQLQTYIDSFGQLPSTGDPDEYAALFEEVYPSEADRRVYIHSKVAGAKPSYGHLALATLMHAKRTRLVWTTNFDAMVADACAKVYGTTGSLMSVDLDVPELGEQAIREERWPVEVKLHGDFHSRRLKNTAEELRHQDARLRNILIDSCSRFGLVVAGYSGRDDSVMDALDEATQQPGAFPSGLFWLHHGEGLPLPRVRKLLAKADEKGIEVGIVSIDSFDEVLRDLIRQIDDIDTTTLDAFASERRHWSAAPRPTGKRGWPVVRFNAVPVTGVPSVCRCVVCDIGGTAEVREAIERAGVDVIAVRSQAGVLAFGADADVRTAFEPNGITDFDLHTFETKRQRYESSERGLLREALTRAIARQRGLEVVRRGRADLLAPTDPKSSTWTKLEKLVGTLTGTVAGSPELHWREGIGIRLDWAGDRLWLLIEPRTVFDGITQENKMISADFGRERSVRRYNKQLNDLVEFWSRHLGQNKGNLRTLDIGDGIDAIYRLSPITGFSRRVGA
ncbi:MAG: SIR2 family protein [Candidatus Latescibacteria bacterium]|nr:SIR2 family protein [Candidatus Latescibacterota bacterium]